MWLAYVDESGDVGPVGAGGSLTFCVAAVLLPAARWPSVFDELIDFRRYLRRTTGLPVRVEIKANYLIRNGGAFRSLGLGDNVRRRIYRMHMRLHPKLDLAAFAVVADKQKLAVKYPTLDPRVIAWENLLQRLERFSTKKQVPLLINHDDGDAVAVVRKLARKARRAGAAGSMFGTGLLKVPARLFVDDPQPRDSSQSYLIQLADLCAYAAFRRVYAPGMAVGRIVPQGMWDELGDARLAQVNQYSGGPTGIVIRR